MSRRRGDVTDLLCQRWAAERRKVLGLAEPDRAREMVGAPRCTLAERAMLTGGGGPRQHFPEVYTGDALIVHRAFKAMPESVGQVFEVHYVSSAPAKVKAHELRMALRAYWERVGQGKAIVESFLRDHKVCAQKSG